MLTQETRKCLKCGKVYTYFAGGVVYVVVRECPECGSKLTIPWV